MGRINSRDKGARIERYFCHLFEGMGFKVHRTQQYCGKAGDADIEGIPGLHIECKGVQKLNVYTAMEQAVNDMREGEIPMVAHKKDYKYPLITIRAEDSVEWARRWLAGIEKDD